MHVRRNLRVLYCDVSWRRLKTFTWKRHFAWRKRGNATSASKHVMTRHGGRHCPLSRCDTYVLYSSSFVCLIFQEWIFSPALVQVSNESNRTIPGSFNILSGRSNGWAWWQLPRRTACLSNVSSLSPKFKVREPIQTIQEQGISRFEWRLGRCTRC